MNKDKILEVAGAVGKATIRGVAYVGTNIAVIGGGILGTVLYANQCKTKAGRNVITVVGTVGSMLAGYTVGSLVDDKLVEEYDLDIDGI